MTRKITRARLDMYAHVYGKPTKASLVIHREDGSIGQVADLFCHARRWTMLPLRSGVRYEIDVTAYMRLPEPAWTLLELLGL